MKHEIKFKLAFDEYRESLKEDLLGNRKFLYLIIMMLMFFGYCDSLLDSGKSFQEMFLLVSASAVFLFAVYYVVYRNILYIVSKKKYCADRTIQEEQSVVFSEDEIVRGFNSEIFTYKPADVEKVYSGKRTISLELSDCTTLIIPRSSFKSPEEGKEIEELISRHFAKN